MQPLARSLRPTLSKRMRACGCPLVMDIYNACDCGCLYCDSHYKASWKYGSQRYNQPIIHSLRESDIRKLIYGALTGALDTIPEPYQKWAPYIIGGYPIQIGEASDPFITREKDYKITLAILRMLHDVDIPVVLSTKAAWWVKEGRYTEILQMHPDVQPLKRTPWHVKFSISSLDPRSKDIEIGVPDPYERLETMQILSSLGVSTSLWLRPFIPGLSDDWKQLFEAAIEAGAKAVSVEWLTVPPGNDIERKARLIKLSRILGYDILSHYIEGREGSTLKPSLKRGTMEQMRAYAHARGLKFTVSDIHNKDLSDCGNCCGGPASMNFMHANMNWIVRRAHEVGDVRWADIGGDLGTFAVPTVKEMGLSAGWTKPKAAKYSKMTLSEYIRALWNDPENKEGFWLPYGKIITPAGRDITGNAIYKPGTEG